MGNTDLGLGARFWEAEKIRNGSNTLKRFDAEIDKDSIETYANFAKKLPEASGIDNETKADDRLLKYTVTRITPTRNLDEVSNMMEMYLITDQHGHDIGTYEVTENGPVFKLSPKIEKGNEAIIAGFPDKEVQDILRERFEIDTLEELTKKLSTDDELAISSNEQAKDVIKEDYEKKGLVASATETGNSNQSLEEVEAINKIPSDMRMEVIEQCRKKGVMIKDILIVDDPKSVANQMNQENSEIDEAGEPIIMIQAKSKGNDKLADDLYIFQGDKEIADKKEHNDRLLELMEQHSGDGAVTELNDIKEKEIEAQIKELGDDYERKMEENEKLNFVDEENREKAQAGIITEFEKGCSSILKYYNNYQPSKKVINTIGKEKKEIEENDEGNERTIYDNKGHYNY